MCRQAGRQVVYPSACIILINTKRSKLVSHLYKRLINPHTQILQRSANPDYKVNVPLYYKVSGNPYYALTTRRMGTRTTRW